MPGCQFQWPWIHIWLFRGKQMGGKWNTQAQLVQGSIGGSDVKGCVSSRWTTREMANLLMGNNPFIYFFIWNFTLLLRVCPVTSQASQSCCRQGCWVWRCCYRDQNGSLVRQTIHQNRSPEEDTVVCGLDAWSDKKVSTMNISESTFFIKTLSLRTVSFGSVFLSYRVWH